MKLPTIYCDMDDVLCDFSGYVKATSLDLNSNSWRDKVLATPDWWYKIPPRSDAKTLFEFLRKYKPYILSGQPAWDNSAKEQKYRWIRDVLHYPKDHVYLVHWQRKKDYAVAKDGTRNVLIDDYERNVKEWRDAGGIAIQHIGAGSTIMKLKELGFN